MSRALHKDRRFPEDRARMYLCEIMLALEDLHKRNIIYRDLKPDNIVFDSMGHALLTDFGLAKEDVAGSNQAKSFCGSPAYLAPEMLKRAGHGKAIDWYLTGVLLYEMLVGIPPYYSNNKE
jgi:serine/threonine protein kinase